MDTTLKIIGVIFAILFFGSMPYVFSLIASHIFKTSYSYRSEHPLTEPDDLKNIVKKVRKKVDKNYSQRKRIEEEFELEYNPIDKKFNDLIFQQVTETHRLDIRNFSKEEIDDYISKKYSSKLVLLLTEKNKIKEKYERILGYPLK